MKRIMSVLALILAMAIPAMAMAQESLSITDMVKRIPNLKQGFGYSFIDHDFGYLATVELAKWKDISFEAGYNWKNKAIGVISYDFFKLKDFGVTLPILNLVGCKLGVYAGYGRIDLLQGGGNQEFDYGASATILEIKF